MKVEVGVDVGAGAGVDVGVDVDLELKLEQVRQKKADYYRRYYAKYLKLVKMAQDAGVKDVWLYKKSQLYSVVAGRLGIDVGELKKMLGVKSYKPVQCSSSS